MWSTRVFPLTLVAPVAVYHRRAEGTATTVLLVLGQLMVIRDAVERQSLVLMAGEVVQRLAEAGEADDDLARAALDALVDEPCAVEALLLGRESVARGGAVDAALGELRVAFRVLGVAAVANHEVASRAEEVVLVIRDSCRDDEWTVRQLFLIYRDLPLLQWQHMPQYLVSGMMG